MPKIPAHRSNQQVGWVNVPPQQSFDWTLRLRTAPGMSVTVPVRVMTKDRGWTQFYYADLEFVSQYQLELLAANRLYEPAREQDAA